MPSFKSMGFLALEKMILKVFTINWHGGHLGHMTKTIFMNLCPLPKKAQNQNLPLNGQAISEKLFKNNGHISVYI